MLHFIKGDLFACRADIRVNPVNCVGTMGKGLALEFKKRYPKMFDYYAKLCRTGSVYPGKLIYWVDGLTGDMILNFPTKDHWRHDSRYEWIQNGLVELETFLFDRPDVSIAMPALGCGNGNLEWARVSDMIRQILGSLDNDITVIEPHE